MATETKPTGLPEGALCQEYVPPVWPKTERPSVFLAGSIEMGKAIDWQSAMTIALSDLPVAIFNPRRIDWNAGWTQSIHHPQFNEQVNWEMDQLIKADVIALFLQPGTMSPISLLELGLHAASGKLIVCCPEGFWRRGNVEIVCHRYKIPLHETIEELTAAVKGKLQELCDKQPSSEMTP